MGEKLGEARNQMSSQLCFTMDKYFASLALPLGIEPPALIISDRA